jgi:hypothetical protein
MNATRILATHRRVAMVLVMTCSVAAGCGFPVATMHGPVPVPTGATVMTTGMAPLLIGEGGDEAAYLMPFGVFVTARWSINERTELGVGGGLLSGLTGDVKYNVLRGPIAVSAALGASMGFVPDFDLWGSGSDDEMTVVVGLQPTVLAGTERLYGGAKLMLYAGDADVKPLSVLFAGGSLGGRWQFVPEVGVVRDSDDGSRFWYVGVGVRSPTSAPLVSRR